MTTENPFDGEWLDEIILGLEPDKIHEVSPEDDIDDSWLPEQISDTETVKVQTALFYLSSHYPTVESLNYVDIDRAATGMMRTLANFVERATFQVRANHDVVRKRVGDHFPDYSVNDVYFGILWQRKLLKNDLPGRIEGTPQYSALKTGIEHCTSIAKIAKRAIELENKRKGLTS